MGNLAEARKHYEIAFRRMPEQFGQVASFCFGCEGVFNHPESRILTSSSDGNARVWKVSHVPRGYTIEFLCRLLPDFDTSSLKVDYGMVITEPICGPETPAPDWAELSD